MLFTQHPRVAVASFPQRTDEFPESLAATDFGPTHFAGTHAQTRCELEKVSCRPPPGTRLSLTDLPAFGKKGRSQQARAALAQDAATPATPTPPFSPGDITIQRPGGRNTVIHMPPGGFANTIPPQARDISVAFFLMVAAIIIGLPLARAFARRMDRRGGAAQIPNEISSQLTHLNQAVDAIALEVERISEGQRFAARLLSEQRDAGSQTLPSGANR